MLQIQNIAIEVIVCKHWFETNRSCQCTV